MEYQNNDSEYFQKNNQEVKSEYFINSSQDSSCVNRNAYRHNIRRIKRQIKAITLILGCGAIIITERGGITNNSSSIESEIENQVISNTELQDETVNHEVLEESIPADVEEDVIVLTAEEKDYILNLKSALDAEDYDGVNQMMRETIYGDILSKCKYTLENGRVINTNSMECMHGNETTESVICIGENVIYYGDFANGINGSGISFRIGKTYSSYGYYIGEWANNMPNGEGVNYYLTNDGRNISMTLSANFEAGVVKGMAEVNDVWIHNDGVQYSYIYRYNVQDGHFQVGLSVVQLEQSESVHNVGYDLIPINIDGPSRFDIESEASGLTYIPKGIYKQWNE